MTFEIFINIKIETIEKIILLRTADNGYKFKNDYTELSEAQNYAYWDANFCLSTHKFYNAGVLRRHVF